MITVNEALALLHKHNSPLTPKLLPLRKAAGLVLSQAVYTPQDIPAFRQSAMDGYAFNFADWTPGQPLQITGEIAAGADITLSLQRQQAARIFTGAPMPNGADTVVMQEKTDRRQVQLNILDTAMQAGSNVRPIGSEAAKDTLALPAGTLLTPAAIGFLATLGFDAVPVYPAPVIQIVVTGNELQSPGVPLQHGQVYESNSYTLVAALAQLNIRDVPVHAVRDDINLLQQTLQTALSGSDILLITGGVSVGDYDYVAQALAQCGVQTLFHRIRQKPGKPLFAGSCGKKIVFGLPGNPSSVLTCFYEYVLPVIEQQMQIPVSKMIEKRARLTHDFTKSPGLTQFLKGTCTGDNVALLNAQESYKLNSFALANCLVKLEAPRNDYKAGEWVTVHLLP